VRGPVAAVFVDRTGRRRRVATIAGSGLGAAALVALGLLVSGVSGGAPAHLPGLPGLPPNAGRAGFLPASAAASAPAAPRPSTPFRTPTGVVRTPSPIASATPVIHGHKPSQTPSHPGQSKRK
jgi:hypothetical protein